MHVSIYICACPPHSHPPRYPQVVIFVMSVVLTMPVLLNAQSNWLIGSLLITTYCFWCVHRTHECMHACLPACHHMITCVPAQLTNITDRTSHHYPPITIHTQRVRILVRAARTNARDARRQPRHQVARLRENTRENFDPSVSFGFF